MCQDDSETTAIERRKGTPRIGVKETEAKRVGATYGGMEMEGGPREITGMLFGDESSPPPPFLCQQSLWCSWVVCRHLVSLWHRQADRQETG